MKTTLQTTAAPNFNGLFKITDKRISGQTQEQSKELVFKLRELVFDQFVTRTSVDNTPVLVTANSKDGSLMEKLKVLGIKFSYKYVDPADLYKRGLSNEEMASSFNYF